jgi:hypothetical protein
LLSRFKKKRRGRKESDAIWCAKHALQIATWVAFLLLFGNNHSVIVFLTAIFGIVKYGFLLKYILGAQYESNFPGTVEPTTD